MRTLQRYFQDGVKCAILAGAGEFLCTRSELPLIILKP